MQMNPAHTPLVRRWLLAIMALIVVMVGVGGTTRLTESGLSIVEWKLVSGILPPMNATAWQGEFKDYQTSPQFQKVNRNFALDDFKHIYWLEYIHRLIGRLVGMVVLLPFLYFAVRGWLSRPMLWRCALLFVLVAAQGVVGWIMVASGLVDQPRVAPIKLAAHLSLAFIFFLTTLWTYWQLGEARPSPAPRGVALAARGLFALVFVQIIFGALVAGLRAGLTYNTYPLMDGDFLPPGLQLLSASQVLTVQFQHRMGALAVLAGVIGFAAYAWCEVADRRPLRWLLAAVFLQFALGVATLLSVVAVPIAVTHQLVALLLLGSSLRTIKAYPFAQA